MDASPIQGLSDARAWWAARRKPYNVALVLAGIGAFACYAATVEHFSCNGPGCGEGPEITLFTIAFQGAGYLLAMAVANLLYGLGALSEKLYRPKDRQAWRRRWFAIGLCFSVALPFLVPVLAWLHFASRHRAPG